MRWGEANTLHFVKLYLDKEYLWNPAHEWYKNKFKREKAYESIILEFEGLTGKCMTIPEVKIKIKNLRSTYTQQVQKVLQKSRPDFKYEPSLVWFHEMDRCLKYVPTGKPTTNSSPEIDEGDEEDIQAEWSDEELPDNSFGDESLDPLIPISLIDNQYVTIIQEEYVAQVKTEPDSSLNHTSNTYQLKKKVKKFKKSPGSYFIKSRNECTTEDEFDIYGKYIASQLRQMDLQKALHVQLQIQNLVQVARKAESSESSVTVTKHCQRS